MFIMEDHFRCTPRIPPLWHVKVFEQYVGVVHATSGHSLKIVRSTSFASFWTQRALSPQGYLSNPTGKQPVC